MTDRVDPESQASSKALSRLPNTFKILISDLTVLAAPITIGFFALSMLYEWSYFRIVGPEFQSLMSTTDYVANAILWIPPSILGMLYYVDFPALGHKASSPSKKNTRLQEWLLAIVGSGSVIAFLSALYFLPQTAMVLYAFLFVGAWVTIVYYWYRIGPAPSLIRWKIVRSVPPLVFAVFAFGYSAGQKAITQVERAYIVRTKTDGTEHRVTILRNLDRGLLARDVLNGRIVLYRWDDVVAVARSALGPPQQTPACTFFGWNCIGENLTP